MRTVVQSLTLRRHVVPASGLGAALMRGDARLSRPVRRGVHARVASTQELLTNTEAPSLPTPLASPAYDRPGSPPGSSTTAATSYRLLPPNYAPETIFTVDNVAAADVRHFTIHPSVPYWQDVGTSFGSFPLPSEPGPLPSQLADVPSMVSQLLTSALASGDATSAAYWAYHLARTTFFFGAAVAGATTHHLAYQAQSLLQSLGLSSSSTTNTSTSSSSSASTSSGGSSSAARKRTPFESLSANAQAEVVNRLQEALAVYRRDLQAVQEGQYKLPWDMTDFPGNRQYNPLFVGRMLASFCGEAVATLNRRLDGGPAPNWFTSNMYPSYYAESTFHYQSDGWFSSRSAAVYEVSTEVLFFGRQDAMQRSALLPLAEHIRARGLDPSRLTLAEVGCGTGRFHTFIKDNYPDMSTIASDLSPFYLARARDNVNYWKQQRMPGRDLGGADGTGVQYMQAPMEDLPVPDASLDVVVCVYCFHEMPEEARSAAAAEWFRVLKPGGLVVLTDSVQLGDRPVWDQSLGGFGNMNEPHYRNYIACDLGSLFEAAGLDCGTKYLCSATKTLSFTKPNQAEGQGGQDTAQGAHLN